MYQIFIGVESIAEVFNTSVFHNFKWLEVSGYHLCQLFIYLPLSQWGQDKSCEVMTETICLDFVVATGIVLPGAWPGKDVVPVVTEAAAVAVA